MYWKRFLSAVLLCVPTSLAFAAPTVNVVNVGLNASGDWVWDVRILPPDGSPLAAELGFRELVSTLKSATNLSTGAGDDFDKINPGKAIFGWELPGIGTNNN